MLDEGFEPVIYELSSSLGGLWAYRGDSQEGLPSVMWSTVINSSKELGAFSDFPPPKEAPNFMHHTKMLAYIRSYADHFGITGKVRLRHEVLRVAQAEDYDSTGRWDVLVKDLNGDVECRETFDAVLVASGHYGFPNVPTFKGKEKFKGKIVHTHSLKVPDQFKDRRVAVVGIGNSGVDAAVDACHVAAEVYLSTRRGSWISRRMGPHGKPIDFALSTRARILKGRLLPLSVSLDTHEAMLNRNFNHEAYGLRPKHRINAQHLTTNDALPSLIVSGLIRIKKTIVEFTEDGVLFEGDEEVTKLDDVILATGYKFKFPMLSEDVMPAVVDNEVQLYKYVFPPGLKHPTLAVIGLVQPLGAVFPIAEMQARWMAQLLAGKCKLPPQPEMYQDIARTRAALRRRFVDSPRHTVQVDWVRHMDELADKIGARPKLLKCFFTDYELFRALLGPTVPYQLVQTRRAASLARG
ncbi:flavin-containing monooxygenase 5-like [Ixodes scapularis]|uniref:flavin-containing monooxygenase 5-like n=1 Tax=Ixodes scapularis TaxID=6945 RepID=UPI001A9EFD2D|nr:flavin-containing monooxygenase 5-like [Ixodes scapularis]